MTRTLLVRFALCSIGVFAASPTARGQSTPQVPTTTVGTPAADSALDAQTRAVAVTLRCPVCQGESIQESPSSLAKEMRAVVRERLRAGESPEQVKAYFVSRYGEWILLEPKLTGLNVALYLLPVILILGGLVLVVFLVRRWTRQAGPVSDDTTMPQTAEPTKDE